ncbi:MAG: helix-turn-helix domain-containing protein, partial [Halanaerobium sp.]
MANTKIKDMNKSIDELKNEKPELKEVFEDEDPVYELRKKILELRLEKGYSQAELAKKAGTKQAVISRIENGESEPRIDTVNK